MPKTKSKPSPPSPATAPGVKEMPAGNLVYQRGDGYTVALADCTQRREGDAWALIEKASGGMIDSRKDPWPHVPKE